MPRGAAAALLAVLLLIGADSMRTPRRRRGPSSVGRTLRANLAAPFPPLAEAGHVTVVVLVAPAAAYDDILGLLRAELSPAQARRVAVQIRLRAGGAGGGGGADGAELAYSAGGLSPDPRAAEAGDGSRVWEAAAVRRSGQLVRVVTARFSFSDPFDGVAVKRRTEALQAFANDVLAAGAAGPPDGVASFVLSARHELVACLRLRS